MVDSFKTAEAAAEQKRREDKEANRALAAKYAPQVGARELGHMSRDEVKLGSGRRTHVRSQSMITMCCKLWQFA
jgi:hypothetical protein